MANSDKNIVITPNIGNAVNDPKIVFTGANTANSYDITLTSSADANGSLIVTNQDDVELFAVTSDSSDTIFQVNDGTGVATLTAYSNGEIKFTNINLTGATTTGLDTGPSLPDSIFSTTGASVNTIHISAGSSVGIGTVSPAYKLHVNGDIFANGDVISVSDEKLKKDIKTVDFALDSLDNIRGVHYTFIENNHKSIGVLAQEVQKEFPELVFGEETLSVNYDGLIGVLIEAVKELRKEVNELKNDRV